jgi:hypothetical protein
MVPGLEERIMESTEEGIVRMAELVSTFFCIFLHLVISCKDPEGASGARADDTKSLKMAIIDWITPRNQPLNPSLTRNQKADRGYHHECTGASLCPAGLDWNNPR